MIHPWMCSAVAGSPFGKENSREESDCVESGHSNAALSHKKNRNTRSGIIQASCKILSNLFAAQPPCVSVRLHVYVISIYNQDM